MVNRTFHLPALAVVAATLCCLTVPASCSTFLFSGVFTQDDNLLQFQFTIAGNATVTLQSLGYAGGTDTASGGFAPVLALFGPLPSGDPFLVGYDAGAAAPNCGPRLIDPVTQECLDADLVEALTAGTYLVTLTENDNTPNSPDYNAGFNEAGNGNFTGTNAGFPGSSFLDPVGGQQRTPNFTFSIAGVDSASALPTPEPSALILLLCGLGMLAVGVSCGRWRLRPTNLG